MQVLVGLARKERALFLRINDVPWMLERLAMEVNTEGVEHRPEEPILKQPYFSVRERAWIERAVAADGLLLRKSVAVPEACLVRFRVQPGEAR